MGVLNLASCRALTVKKPLLCALIMVFSALGLADTLKPVPPNQILGAWETIQVLVSDRMRNVDLIYLEGDSRLIGRKYGLHAHEVVELRSITKCRLNTSLANRTFPLKTIFATSQIARPTIIRERLAHAIENYGSGQLLPLANLPVTLYSYKCSGREKLGEMGNWFAATHDRIFWPLMAGTLAVLQKQPKDKTPEQVVFCKTATLASDKVICSDRELWLMKQHTDSVRACAIAESSNKKMRSILEQYVVERQRCEGDRECIIDAYIRTSGR
jgi:hypothetical protein